MAARGVPLLCLVLAACPVPAGAQPAPRVSVALNGGLQPTATELDNSFTFTVHQETGSTRVSYPIERAVVFDAGGGVRLWGGLGAGLAVSRVVRDGTALTTTSVPHPLYLQQHREVTGEARGIRREESGLHVQAQYQVASGGRLGITLMGGPSLLQVHQTLVTAVDYREAYPYDTADFTGARTRRGTATGSGFNVGADVRWMLTRHIGMGGVLRFTRATVGLDAPGSGRISVDAGGAHVGAGLRFTF